VWVLHRRCSVLQRPQRVGKPGRALLLQLLWAERPWLRSGGSAVVQLGEADQDVVGLLARPPHAPDVGPRAETGVWTVSMVPDLSTGDRLVPPLAPQGGRRAIRRDDLRHRLRRL
jgi:hypothetical protein